MYWSGMAGSSARYRQTPDWARFGGRAVPKVSRSIGHEVLMTASSNPPQSGQAVNGRVAAKVWPQSMQRTVRLEYALSGSAREESWIRLTAPPKKPSEISR